MTRSRVGRTTRPRRRLPKGARFLRRGPLAHRGATPRRIERTVTSGRIAWRANSRPRFDARFATGSTWLVTPAKSMACRSTAAARLDPRSVRNGRGAPGSGTKPGVLSGGKRHIATRGPKRVGRGASRARRRRCERRVRPSMTTGSVSPNFNVEALHAPGTYRRARRVEKRARPAPEHRSPLCGNRRDGGGSTRIVRSAPRRDARARRARPSSVGSRSPDVPASSSALSVVRARRPLEDPDLCRRDRRARLAPSLRVLERDVGDDGNSPLTIFVESTRPAATSTPPTRLRFAESRRRRRSRSDQVVVAATYR